MAVRGTGPIRTRGLSLMLVLALTIAGAWCGGARGSGSSRQSGEPDPTALVDSYLQPYLATRNFSGVILLARGGQVLLSRGYGMADYGLSVPNSVETRFPIASLSKTFTAAAVLKLSERGSLSLDDPIQRFLPEFPNGSLITIRHLLDHTSGLPRMVFFPDYPEKAQQTHTAGDLVDWIRDKPLAFPVGQRYGYSNSNYALLARIIEIASSADYGDFLKQSFFDPFRLENTGHLADAAEIVPNLARGFAPEGERDLKRARFHDYSIATGSGSLYSTAGDLLKWFGALRSGQVVDRNLLGHVWIEDEWLGRKILRKQGWDGVGFAARWIHFLQEDLTVIVLSNLNISAVTTEIAENLSSIALEGTFNRFEVAPSARVEPSLLSRFEGTYEFGPDFYVPGARMRVISERGRLLIEERPGQRSPLMPLPEREFIHRPHWLRVKFEENGEGRITGMKYGSFEAARAGGD